VHAELAGRPEYHLAHPYGALYLIYHRRELSEEIPILHALWFAEPISMLWLSYHGAVL